MERKIAIPLGVCWIAFCESRNQNPRRELFHLATHLESVWLEVTHSRSETLPVLTVRYCLCENASSKTVESHVWTGAVIWLMCMLYQNDNPQLVEFLHPWVKHLFRCCQLMALKFQGNGHHRHRRRGIWSDPGRWFFHVGCKPCKVIFSWKMMTCGCFCTMTPPISTKMRLDVNPAPFSFSTRLAMFQSIFPLTFISGSIWEDLTDEKSPCHTILYIPLAPGSSGSNHDSCDLVCLVIVAISIAGHNWCRCLSQNFTRNLNQVWHQISTATKQT